MAEDVSGEMIFESRDVYESFFVRDAESCKHIFNVAGRVKDCYHFSSFGNGAELVYDSASCGSEAYECRWCAYCWNGCRNVAYCLFCVGCQDCFGCIGLKQRQYAIFNRQYTRSEYERLVCRIVEHMQETGEWGAYFPLSLSVVPYNESHASRFFAKTEVQCRAEGLWWEPAHVVDVAGVLDPGALPDGLPDDENPLTVRSIVSEEPFRISREEIRRYRELGVPLPRSGYNERMERRAREIGGIQLFERTCPKTGKSLQSTIPPDSPWIVWDREAYQAEFA